MILIELLRNGLFSASLHSVAPFIYKGETKYFSLKTSWGSSCDDIFDTILPVKVLQVTQNYLDKYLPSDNYSDCVSQEGSYFFDRINNVAYLHVVHDSSPLTSDFDYSYSFGFSEFDVIYIDDYEYLPLITSIPNLDRETDYTNSKQPTGSVASITLKNMEYVNSSGERVGRLDFLITEKLYNNDVFIYRYNQETQELTPLSYKYIEEITIGEEDAVIDLQDRRFS